MIINLFAIKDTKVAEFVSFNSLANEVDFVRGVYQESLNPHSKLYLFPSDFELYKLGTVDTKSGAITEELKFISNLTDLKKSFEVTTHEG